MANQGEEETKLQLLVTRSVTLDGNGNGVVSQVGPVASGERWEITATQTSIPISTTPGTMNITRTNNTQVVEGTNNASLDNSNTVFNLQNGESLTYTYISCTPSSVASITLSGNRYLRGRRAY